jgi:hypothetical protein
MLNKFINITNSDKQVLPSLWGVASHLSKRQFLYISLNRTSQTARRKTTRASKLPKQRAILATLNKLARYNYESNASVS